MNMRKTLLSLTGAVLALSLLTVPASAHGGHHGGGHHGARATTTAVYCAVCDSTHDRGACPNDCGDCGYSHTGDCAPRASAGHHKGHGCR